MKISWKPPKSSKNHIFSDFLSFFQVFTERISEWRSHPSRDKIRKIPKQFRNKIFLACTCDSDSQALDSNNVSILVIFKVLSNSINFSKIHNKLALNLIKSCVTPLVEIHSFFTQFLSKIAHFHSISLKNRLF